MLRNYFKIAIRNLIRNKVYSLINILGLSLGLTCSMLILLWIQDELSYDQFHTNSENLYRVGGNQQYNDQLLQVVSTPLPLAPTLKKDFPEVVRASRASFNFSKFLLRYEQKFFNEESMMFVDDDFLPMFSFALKYGDKESALQKPNSIVLTYELAEKYFGSENPIGKTMIFQSEHPVEVTGVLEKIPEQSTLKFSALLHVELMKKMDNIKEESWDGNMIRTYVELKEGADVQSFHQKFANLVRENSKTNPEVLFLQPLSEVYLYTDFNKVTPRIVYVYMFAGIAILILLIACANFVNLSTARSVKRAKEVGLRKVIGANRSQLIQQFFGEAILSSLIALVIGCILIEVLMSGFNELTLKKLEFSVINPIVLLQLLSLTLVMGMLAGIYPALILSSFQPVQILKGNFYSGKKGIALRRVLVVAQFSIAIALIFSTLIIFGQLNYMQGRDIGFDKEHVIYINLNDKSRKNYNAFKQELLKNKNIQSVSASYDLITNYGSSGWGVQWRGKEKDEKVLITFTWIKNDFINTLGMELKEGRDFETDADSLSAIINESAAKAMKLENPLQEKITFEGDTSNTKYSIIGVLKDYNYNSLQYKSGPLLATYCQKGNETYVYIKTNPGDMKERVAEIESVWGEMMEDQPFEYQYLDSRIERLYQNEKRLSGIFGYFAFLAIFISCLGLLGLVSYTIETRTKEIGIRKVLGASIWSIIQLVSKDFIVLVGIAMLIAIPTGAYLMNQWLENFAYRISLAEHWYVFAEAIGIAILISAITISSQALNISRVNPVNILKDQ